MRIRLLGKEVRSLYASGASDRFPGDVIPAFFGVLEAIEAAPDVADLHALVSVAFESQADGAVRFGLRAGMSLVCRTEMEDGATIFTIEKIERSAKGGPGA